MPAAAGPARGGGAGGRCPKSTRHRGARCLGGRWGAATSPTRTVPWAAPARRGAARAAAASTRSRERPVVRLEDDESQNHDGGDDEREDEHAVEELAVILEMHVI